MANEDKENSGGEFVEPRGILTSSLFNAKSAQKEPLTQEERAAARRKQLEQSMNARREAMILKKLQTPRKPKFLPDETAQKFVSFTGLESPVAPFTIACDVEERKAKQLSALRVWMNHVLCADLYDTSEADALMEKTKSEANKFLRDMLVSAGKTSSVSSMKDQTVKKPKARFDGLQFNRLRAIASKMFEDSPWPADIKRMVESEEISIKSDKNVFSDIGLQTEILQLFLSFNPVWLQLGLEVISGKKLFANTEESERSLPVITRFILKNILSDATIMSSKKCAVGSSKSLITPFGATMLHRHFLLCLCHFLVAVELMRSADLVPQIKCMFLKKAPFKSLADVYTMLSRELLSGSTNLPKLMRKIGFVSDFKQGFLDEYDYVVGPNVTKHLSDGLVLGRLIEIVGGYPADHVTAHLRNPGGDRLRKLENVRTVLKMAQEKGVDLGDVKAEQIIGVSVEAVLELLWRIVGFYTGTSFLELQERTSLEDLYYHFSKKNADQGDEGNADKQELQSLEVAEVESFFDDSLYHEAATKIQSAVRGFLLRRNFANEIEKRKKWVQGWRAQEEVEHAGNADEPRSPEDVQVEDSPIDESLCHRAATMIQAAARGFLVRRQLAAEIEEWKCFMEKWRDQRKEESAEDAEMERSFIDESQCHKAATTIQAAVRGYLVRKRLGDEMEKRKRWMEKWRKCQAMDANHDFRLPIYTRTVDCLEMLLNDNFSVRIHAARYLVNFVSASLKCAEYIVSNDGIPIIMDSMDNLNRGMCTEEALYRLTSVILALAESDSQAIITRVKQHSADLIGRLFHHMYAHKKSERILTTCGMIIVRLCKAHVSREQFDKVRFHQKKLWESCHKLPKTDTRYRIFRHIQKYLGC
ncbi:hypothetical protein L596_015035 [Steinernema carpocapsae]|uniref:Calponin-homology (CH) domain-containing protein n=1 Tax=Steinernema carpocapsae TaxID=34508 RepID=A0A4U5NDR3_STECR|nr:hypothetical protein L596_015035 [Steinernema carpocapsae]